jgi:GNAT superfamily N-acetyltransferase
MPVPVLVRDATERDAVALSELWADLVAHPGVDAMGDPPDVVMAKAVTRYVEDDQGRIIVAEVDGLVVGCAFLRIGLISPVDEGGVVQLSHVQVAPEYGRQGVGTALVEATLSWAEHRGIESLVAALPAHDREANRFLARLGMALVANLRGGSVPALRARLAHAPAAAVRQKGRSGRNVGQVVAARRSQRRARIRQIAP